MYDRSPRRLLPHRPTHYDASHDALGFRTEALNQSLFGFYCGGFFKNTVVLRWGGTAHRHEVHDKQAGQLEHGEEVVEKEEKVEEEERVEEKEMVEKETPDVEG
ncbi:unnamed protein product [Arctogadus glacialis]